MTPFAADLLDDLEDLGNDQRRQAQRGLVEQQQAWARHQGAADGQHLLFAAGHGAGALVGPLAQAREEVERMFQAGLDLFAVLEETTHLQVLGDGHVGKDAPASGEMAMPLRMICGVSSRAMS